MELCGEFIMHRAFGRGQIVEFENNSITVIFQEKSETKKFIYPEAFGKFLTLENLMLVKQVQDYQNEIASSIAAVRQNEALRVLELQEKSKIIKKPVRKAASHKTVKKG